MTNVAHATSSEPMASEEIAPDGSIVDRREGESARLTLSNFFARPDRESGDLLLHMSRLFAHDDGAAASDGTAEVVLVGVSRVGKTPTCLYLALQYGVYAANYPLTEEDFAQTESAVVSAARAVVEAMDSEAKPVCFPGNAFLTGG